MNKRNIFIIVGIVVLFLFCCCVLIAIAAGTFMISKNVITETNNPLPLIETLESVQLDPTPAQSEVTKTPSLQDQPKSETPDAEMFSMMDSIENQVEKLRGLSLSNEVSRTTLPQGDLRERVLEDFFADYSEEDSQNDAIILDLFGLLNKDYDLYNLYLDLYSEQIAGFYDDETREMVIVQGEAFTGSEKATYAHEFTHALQDEAFNLKEGLKLDETYCLLDSEYCAAVQALVEGDATLTETIWLIDHSSSQDKRDILEMYESYQSPIYDSAPDFLQEDFLFAYSQGLEFVQSLHDEGGFAAVDAAFLNPPVSTEQILHPDRYPEDVPVKIDLPDFSETLGNGWEEIDRNSLGEWYSFLLLAKSFDPAFRISEDKAKSAAEGWGGDQYLVYRNIEKSQEVLIYRSDWDRVEEADEFWDQFIQYANLRWGEPVRSAQDFSGWVENEKSIALSRLSNQILWVISPELLSETILSSFSVFPQE